MLNSKSFLAVDFGAGSLKLAEFELNEAGGLRLKQFVIKSLGLEGSQETKREATILKALQEVIAERGIKAKDCNVCAPGFHVFSKFVKLPPVDPGKVTQIIQYEAQQNVPFPLEEVVWDYQILGTTQTGELEVLLVAIKSEIVEGLFRLAETSGLRLQLCDVSPAALCNAFRYNYGELEDCTMFLDIGAKTSNLLFFEKGKVFSRSINLGANSITQDFANESKLKFEVAEKIKIEEGFVSLGGAYEEPENAYQAAISKIARQFMTRLHIQVNQTMQFYRGQQGGSAPARLFLSGGAAIMPYTAQFFAEKLNVPVEYFNPFRNVQIDPGVNLEELARVAHSLGETVGLGLRNLAHCPVELNLMPASTLRWQSFNQKKPYLITTVFSVVAMAFAVGFLFERLAAAKKDELANINALIEPLSRKQQEFDRILADRNRFTQQLKRVSDWMETRYSWIEIARELRDVLLRVEAVTQKKLNTSAGIWVGELYSIQPGGQAPEAPGAPSGAGTHLEEWIKRFGATLPQPPPNTPPQPGQPQQRPPGSPPGSGAGPRDISTIFVEFHAVDLNTHDNPDANRGITYSLADELKASGIFAASTNVSEVFKVDDYTFGFDMALNLKRPLKL